MPLNPKMAVGAMAGVAAYLGLAILGGNGFTPFFANPARIALSGVLLILTVASLFSGGNLSPGDHEDRSNRWVLAAFTVIGLL